MSTNRVTVARRREQRRRDASGSVLGPMDAEDLARVLTGFRGQPVALTPKMRYVRSSADGDASAYVFDEGTGMVYILD
jgi:hypothetical protein